jgi:hypothetical protein
MAKQPTLAAHVAKAVASAPTGAIADALSALVLMRLRRTPRPTQPTPSVTPAQRPAPTPSGARRSPRRTAGKLRYYDSTTQPDVSRYGTFRRYMITTIRAHTDTRSANAAHALCDNPSFAKNKLDFNWAADNGYINWR